MDPVIRALLSAGAVISAHPLALTSERRLDERRQRALTRYYAAAGAGGVAIAVHTTQFAIRDPKVGLFEPVLALTAEELDRADRGRAVPMLRVGGVCGRTAQAVSEARRLADLRFHAGLVSLSALSGATEDELVAHCREVAAVIPIFGFYLQPAVGGRLLSYAFWRRFAEIDRVVAIKVAPFNRYQTIDVVRAVADSGRAIPLYTGNDDNIVMDLLAPEFVGGLLGHWAVWTRSAVELWKDCRAMSGVAAVPRELLTRNAQVTDANAAFFDAAHSFAGCIAGLHEVLRRQGLLAGTWCLDPRETLSPGQSEEIDRVYRAYPHLNDDEFVRAHRDEWLR
jgi:dihydrodipicolinate synthase/N-acetylneuraminate lyase